MTTSGTIAIVVVILLTCIALGGFAFWRWALNAIYEHHRLRQESAAEQATEAEQAEQAANYPNWYNGAGWNPYGVGHVNGWEVPEAPRRVLIKKGKNGGGGGGGHHEIPDWAPWGKDWGKPIPGKTFVPGATPSDPGGYVREDMVNWAPRVGTVACVRPGEAKEAPLQGILKEPKLHFPFDS